MAIQHRQLHREVPTLWGLFLKEWHGTSSRTKLLVSRGLFLLIGSTVVVSYGNYLKAAHDRVKTVSSQ